ncbi:MAG: dTMP kinase [Alistipes sp.]|nr:dTMP kinase [Candidatus Alistipes equi]
MFIVLEGLDGAGKSTQIQLLENYLQQRGLQSEYLHFPRYDSKPYGSLISSFLRGEFGSLDEVDPYFVAMLYAEDRMQISSRIKQWLQQGKVVVVDRYVLSNIAYQGAKMHSMEQTKALSEWIFNLEYNIFSIPKPDISFFLDVPFKFTINSLKKNREGRDRDYLNGESDIHEASLDLQRHVREVYIEHSKHDASLKVIDCSLGGEMDTPEGIFSKIADCLEKILK